MKIFFLLAVFFFFLAVAAIIQAQQEEEDLPANIAALADCMEQDTGELMQGRYVQNGECGSGQATFFYGARSAPVSGGNGLVMGAPTDMNLLFVSADADADATTSNALDPTVPGLNWNGRMVIDLSKHFVYNSGGSKPVANSKVELGTGVANAVYGAGGPGCETADDNNPVACGMWSVEFGGGEDGTAVNYNQLVITSPPSGLASQRVQEIGGIKLAHLRPAAVADGGEALYYNANGTCAVFPTTYCHSDEDCPFNDATNTYAACTRRSDPFMSDVTVSVFDASNNLLHKAKQYFPFESQDAPPTYSVFAVNFIPSSLLNTQVNELIDYQRVPPGTLCDTTTTPTSLFSSGMCYAPRFIVYAPPPNGMLGNAYPHAGVPALQVTTKQEANVAWLWNGDEQIGNMTLEQQPPEGGATATATTTGASMMLLDKVMIQPGPGPIGGTILAIPVQLDDDSMVGTYTIRVSMLDSGSAVAESHLVVDESVTGSPTTIIAAAPVAAPKPGAAPEEPTAPAPTASSGGDEPAPSTAAPPTTSDATRYWQQQQQQTTTTLGGVVVMALLAAAAQFAAACW